MGVIAYNKIISQQKINIYSFNFKKNFLKNILQNRCGKRGKCSKLLFLLSNFGYTSTTLPHLSDRMELQKKLKKK